MPNRRRLTSFPIIWYQNILYKKRWTIVHSTFLWKICEGMFT